MDEPGGSIPVDAGNEPGEAHAAGSVQAADPQGNTAAAKKLA